MKSRIPILKVYGLDTQVWHHMARTKQTARKPSAPAAVDWSTKTVVQLRDELKKRKLKHDGLKPVLVKRLQDDDKKKGTTKVVPKAKPGPKP